MITRYLTLLSLASMWLSASAAAYFSAGPSSDRFPSNVTTANPAGVLPLEDCYKHGFTTDGWTVETVESSGYSFVCPTHSGTDKEQDSRLTTAPFTVADSGAWLRWSAKSVLPGFPEAYDVVVTETAANEQFTIARIDAEDCQWQTRLASLDDFVGKEITVSFVCRSANKYMLAVKEISAGMIDEPEWAIESTASRYAALSEGAAATGTITNFGTPADDVSIFCTVGDEEILLKIPGTWTTGETREYSFPLPLSLNESTSYSIGIKDSEGSEEKLLSSDVFASHFKRTLFVDEGTGMWCNNCPDGILELDRLKREYRKDIVIASCHTNDALTKHSYWDNLKFYAIPYMMLNRNRQSQGSSSKNFSKEYQTPTTVEVILPAELTVTDGNVSVEATVRFAEDLDNSDGRYRLGYTVIADIYSPDNEKFYQENKLTFPRGQQYYILPKTIPASLARFDNAVIEDTYSFSGIEGSIPQQISPMTDYYATLTIILPEIAKTSEEVRVVAYVLDTESGLILNAASSVVSNSNETIPSGAHSVAFKENFDNDYTDNFPVLLDLDHQSPTAQVRTLFMDGSGVSRPWWHLKDASASTDRFLGSHSIYSPAATSNDWIGSRAIEIPTTGYTLTFGAQSASLSGNTKPSDLWVFITETPLSEDNIPTEPTLLLKEVPIGVSEDIIEGDFTEYSLNLDEYAGKTIYLSFANLNTDKDILCIDNILIQRLDNAEVSISAPRYVQAGEYTVEVTITATAPEGIKNWSFDFTEDWSDGGLTFEGAEPLACGESITYPVTSRVNKDQTIVYKVSLNADGGDPIVAEGTVSGLAFIPWHGVLVEESTGTWCGNCPGGAYVMECMTSDEEMKDYVVPVSVHINGSGREMMVNEEYANLFAVTSAPAFRFNRSLQVTYLSTAHDLNYDPSNPLSLPAKVRSLHEEITLMEMGLEAKFTDPQLRDKIECKVTVCPALTMDCSQMGIGLVLTENNVGLDNSNYWQQTNYYSGLPIDSELGGWTLLPEVVQNVRFHDVARGVWGYRGFEGSLPEILKCEEGHTFTYTIDIPDTYKELKDSTVTSPAINPDYVSVVAYIYDRANYNVVNAAIVPMTELTEKKFTVRDLVNSLDVEAIGIDNSDAGPTYYNLQGVRVVNPGKGIYMVRRGSVTSKEVVR